jgi:dipeptidyl aminopeptidase/acylaminoacyl peptidase
MNDQHGEGIDPHSYDNPQQEQNRENMFDARLTQEQNKENMFDARLTHVLHTQAERIHFTPQLRNTIIQRLSPRRKAVPRRRLALASTLAAVFLLIFSLITALLHLGQAAVQQFALTQTIAAPAELAHGGQLLSLDPTEHHLVYQPMNQPGVMYVADISNPVASNFLAMRYAHDVDWSPDGSQLVTTVSPEGASQPLLALVRVGQYMNPLGKDAEAASWSPTSPQQIIYATQIGDQLRLWQTTPSGHTAQALQTVQVALSVQHMLWSQDGQKLALIATQENASSASLQSLPAQAIYIMDARTNTLSEVVQPGNFTIGTVGWSPSKHYLTYEQSDALGHTTLHTLAVDQHKELFHVTLQKKLLGWSWAPDDHALVYSDGGTLRAYTLSGPTIQFPQTSATECYPFWLKNGHILYMHITNGVGKLAFLAQK